MCTVRLRTHCNKYDDILVLNIHRYLSKMSSYFCNVFSVALYMYICSLVIVLYLDVWISRGDVEVEPEFRPELPVSVRAYLVLRILSYLFNI